jgi:hypothetical protein
MGNVHTMPAPATALLARLNIKPPEPPGTKLAREVVERAVAAVPPQRRVLAVADLKFYGLSE